MLVVEASGSRFPATRLAGANASQAGSFAATLREAANNLSEATHSDDGDSDEVKGANAAHRKKEQKVWRAHRGITDDAAASLLLDYYF